MGTALSLSEFARRGGVHYRRISRIHGQAEVHLGAAAKLAGLFQGIAPGLTAELLARVNGVMPKPVETREAQKGLQSETEITQSGLTELTRSAEESYNQL